MLSKPWRESLSASDASILSGPERSSLSTLTPTFDKEPQRAQLRGTHLIFVQHEKEIYEFLVRILQISCVPARRKWTLLRFILYVYIRLAYWYTFIYDLAYSIRLYTIWHGRCIFSDRKLCRCLAPGNNLHHAFLGLIIALLAGIAGAIFVVGIKEHIAYLKDVGKKALAEIRDRIYEYPGFDLYLNK